MAVLVDIVDVRLVLQLKTIILKVNEFAYIEKQHRVRGSHLTKPELPIGHEPLYNFKSSNVTSIFHLLNSC